MKLQAKNQVFGARKMRKGQNVNGTLPAKKPNKHRAGGFHNLLRRG